MKQSTRATLGATILIAAANAQTIVNDPADTAVTTIFFSTCPTALTTTTTLSSTITYSCTDGQCPGGPLITSGPVVNGPPQGSEILAYTTTLANGDVEEIHEYVTIYPQICSSGSSIGQATYTVTEPCPCEATKNPASIPAGFTTTVTSCDVCHNGGPTTMTQTMPCTTGPYATVTPQIGPTGAAGANAQAAASAGATAAASAGAGAGGSGSSGSRSSDSSGSGSSGSGAPGSGSNAAANAGASAGANANAQAGGAPGGSTGASGANSASNGNSAAGSNSAGAVGSNNAAKAGADANAAAAAGSNSGNMYNNGTTAGNNTISPPIMPVASGSSDTPFKGAADRVGSAASGVLAIAIGCAAFLL